MWIDIEGGMTANTPAWDVTFLRDVDQELGIAFRYVAFHNKRQRSLVRRSVPPEVFASMREGSTHMLEFAEAKDGKWGLVQHAAVKNKVEACMQAVLLKQVPRDDLLVAWNMNAHDRRILSRVCPSVKHRSWDPLPWFRKRVGLPRNGLGSCSAGTPRHALQVHRMFEHVGPSHTSFVDTLYMRACVRRAVALVMHDMDFSRVAELPAPAVRDVLTCAGAKACQDATIADAAFDADDRIVPECSKAVKRAVRKILCDRLGVSKLPDAVQNSINACRKKESLQRVVHRTIKAHAVAGRDEPPAEGVQVPRVRCPVQHSQPQGKRVQLHPTTKPEPKHIQQER